MTFEEIYKQIEGLEGENWMPSEDARVLYDIAKDIKGTIVEIGCWRGKSSKVLCLASPDSRVISVDPCEGKYTNKPNGIGSDVKPGLFKNMADTKNWEIMIMTSMQASIDWETPIDLLFVDGLHDYDNLMLDISQWVPHIKKGGYVVFHDYWDVAFKGIRKACDECGFEEPNRNNLRGGKTACGVFKI